MVTDDQIMHAWGHQVEHDITVIAGLVGLSISAVRVRLELVQLGALDLQRPTDPESIETHRRWVDIATRYRRGASLRSLARSMQVTSDVITSIVKGLGLRGAPQPGAPTRSNTSVIGMALLPPPTELTDREIRIACRTHPDLRAAALSLQVIPSVLRRRVNILRAGRPTHPDETAQWEVDRPIAVLWKAGLTIDRMAVRLGKSRIAVSTIVKQLRLPRLPKQQVPASHGRRRRGS